jgi:DNA-binding protein YbaB
MIFANDAPGLLYRVRQEHITIAGEGISVDNDGLSHDFNNVLSLVQEQMRDLSVAQKKRAALQATATVAEGCVAVTVDGQRMVTDTMIKESYYDEFDAADLGAYITAAAQQAAREIEHHAAALLAPLTQRRQEISSHAGLLRDAPGFQNLSALIESRSADGDDAAETPDEHTPYPTVRSS